MLRYASACFWEMAPAPIIPTLIGLAHYNEGSSMHLFRLAASAAVAGALLLVGCSRHVSSDVAAMVNGRPVYYSEVDRSYKSQFPAHSEGDNATLVQLRR